MRDVSEMNRRKFLKVSGITGTVLALGYTSGLGFNSSVKKYEDDEILGSNMNDFIFIDEKGKVTIVNHRPEMGQGVYQAMPMLIAEELEVGMEGISIVQTQASREKYGHQQVGGSSSVRNSWEPSRKLGAAARMMFISAACVRWGLNESDCYAKNGKVFNNKNDDNLSYGDLVGEASKLDTPKEPKLKSKKDFRILGKPLPRKDIPLKVNGEAVFGLDMEVPDMLYASVERSPVFLGKVKSFNKAEIMTISGVRDVIKTEMPVFSHKREGVAIVADSYFDALKARKKLKVEWDESGYNIKSQEDIFEDFRKAGNGDDGFVDESKGNFRKAFDSAIKKLEVEYVLPYQAHSTMEPMNCIVSVKDETCEFWGPTQSPNWIRRSLSQTLEIDEKNVTINVSFLGGGFGRRAFNDFPNEAAFISKQIGKPIKVVWKREDDTTQGPFRPGSVNLLKAGFDANNNLVAMQHKTAMQAMGHQWPNSDKSKKPSGMLEGVNVEYDMPNWSTNVVPVEQHIPVMWWRSVHASTAGFAHESFIDEIANELNKDPLKYRIELLQKEPRFVKVLERIAEESNWDKKKKTGTGIGVAIVKSFGSICAHVVEVERQSNKKLQVKRVTSVIDCGQTVNNDTIKAQTEGNIIMALQAAFKGEITFENGRVVEKNFDKYKMLRMDQTPEISVHIMDNEEAPGGVGEPGLPPLAPALCNAIFDESKRRIRKLPFNLDKV